MFAPFHHGKALESYQGGLNQRRLYIIEKANLYSLENDTTAKSKLARLNSSFGVIESTYFRKVPCSEANILVVVFCEKSGQKKALDYYRGSIIVKQKFAVVTDIL